MWWAQDANGEIIGWLYFTSLVVIVSFNVVNLNVAVISSAYKEVRDKRRDIDKLRAKLCMHRAGSNQHDSPTPVSFSQQVQNFFSSFCVAFFRQTPYEDTPVLNPVARCARALTAYPNVIDECGAYISIDIERMASARGLVLSFGPRKGQVCCACANEREAKKEKGMRQRERKTQ